MVGDGQGQDLDDITPARLLGESVWQTIEDGILGVARPEQGLGPLTGETEDATSDPDLMALAELADERDCYALEIAVLDVGAQMSCFLSEVDPTPAVLLTAHLPDSEAAQAEADRVEQALDEQGSAVGEAYEDLFDEAAVTVDDRLVTLEVRLADGVDPMVSQELRTQRDPVFLVPVSVDALD